MAANDRDHSDDVLSVRNIADMDLNLNPPFSVREDIYRDKYDPKLSLREVLADIAHPLKLLWPRSGATLRVGTVIPIYWKADDTISKVYLRCITSLHRHGWAHMIAVISREDPDWGCYRWTVPEYVLNCDSFSIQLEVVETLSSGAEAQSGFPLVERVSSGALKALPYPLELLQLPGALLVGERVPIRWEADSSAVWGVDLEYSTDGGQNWQGLTNTTIRPSNNDWQNYTWSVPGTALGKMARVRLTEAASREYRAVSDEKQVYPVKVDSVSRTRVTPMADPNIADQVLTNCKYKWTILLKPETGNTVLPDSLAVKSGFITKTVEKYRYVNSQGQTVCTDEISSGNTVDARLELKVEKVRQTDKEGGKVFVEYTVPQCALGATPEGPKMVLDRTPKCTPHLASGYYYYSSESSAVLQVRLSLNGEDITALDKTYTVAKGIPCEELKDERLSVPVLVSNAAAEGNRFSLPRNSELTLYDTAIDMSLYDKYAILQFEFSRRKLDKEGKWGDWKCEEPDKTSIHPSADFPKSYRNLELGTYQFKLKAILEHSCFPPKKEKESTEITIHIVEPRFDPPPPRVVFVYQKYYDRNPVMVVEPERSYDVIEEDFSSYQMRYNLDLNDTDLRVTASNTFYEKEVDSIGSTWTELAGDGSNKVTRTKAGDGKSFEYKVKVHAIGKDQNGNVYERDYESGVDPAPRVIATNLKTPIPYLKELTDEYIEVNEAFTLEAGFSGGGTIKEYEWQIKDSTGQWNTQDKTSNGRFVFQSGLPQPGQYELRVVAHFTIRSTDGTESEESRPSSPRMIRVWESAPELQLQIVVPGEDICPTQPVTFTVNGALPNRGSYAWSATGANPDTGTQADFTTAFQTYGAKQVQVVYTVNGRVVGFASATVMVEPPTPTLLCPPRVGTRQPFELVADIGGSVALSYQFEIRHHGDEHWFGPQMFRSGAIEQDHCSVQEGLPVAGDYEARVTVTYPGQISRESTPYASIAVFFTLNASVGADGTNQPGDVRALIDHFISLGFHWTTEANLVEVIRLFQSIVAGQQSIAGNGLVSVPAPGPNSVYNWLRAENAPRWIELPAGSRAAGFYNSERMEEREGYHYATNWFAEEIRLAGVYYHDNYLATHSGAVVITLNDASQERGGHFNDHAGHETGLSCDIKLPRTGGTAGGGVNYYDPTDPTKLNPRYDQNATRAQLQALRRPGSLVDHIYFNDPALIGESLCTASGGHDNHIHFEIHAPARREGQGFD